MIEFTVPGFRIDSVANQKAHRMQIHRARKRHHHDVTTACNASRDRRAAIAALRYPFLVTLTVVRPRRLDDDNANGGCKAARDAIAKILGVDDGDTSKIRFLYAPLVKGPHELRVRIESLAARETA